MQWLNDINEFANPLYGRMFKVVLSLEALQPVLQKYVVDRYRKLESLSAASVSGLVMFKGIYLPDTDHRLSTMGYRRVGIEAQFRVRETRRSQVYLDLHHFRMRDPSSSTVDLMNLASRFLPGVQRQFLRALATTQPKVFQLPEDNESGGILMDLDYFLQKVPGYVQNFGEIRLVRVVVKDGRVHFFVQTNMIMMRLVEFFGPEYLSLEEIQDGDSIELLWEQGPGGETAG